MEALKYYLRRSIRWETALLGVLVVEIIFFGLMNPRFLDPARLLNSTGDFVYLGMIALPLAIVMITGGIDISFGSVASLAAIITGVSFQLGVNIWVAVLIGLFAAVLAGLFNGALILSTGAQPMVITLGTLFLFAGLALGASGLGGVSTFEGISGLPESFVALANGKVLGIPNMLLIFGVMAAIFAGLLNRTSYGRQARLIGANPQAAKYAGMSTAKVLLTTYVLTSLAAGVVGVLLTSYFSSARSDIGASLLIPTLTLVVIGGVSMYGGEGTIGGVIIATFVVGFLQQGLRFMGMGEDYVAIILGSTLVVVSILRWWSGRATEAFKNKRVQQALTSRIKQGAQVNQ